jgi:hypothetical protein
MNPSLYTRLTVSIKGTLYLTLHFACCMLHAASCTVTFIAFFLSEMENLTVGTNEGQLHWTTKIWVLVFIIFVIRTLIQLLTPSKAKLPPGPTPLPFLGNVLRKLYFDKRTLLTSFTTESFQCSKGKLQRSHCTMSLLT